MTFNIGELAGDRTLYALARILLNFGYATPLLRKRLVSRHASKLGSTQANYSLSILEWHFPYICADGSAENKCFAELGPGANVGSLVALLLLGATRVYAFDINRYDHWRDDIAGLVWPIVLALDESPSFNTPKLDILQLRARALISSNLAELDYVAPYDGSMSRINDGSLDGVFSHTVLQYVREPSRLHVEIRRCLKSRASASHHIDLSAQGIADESALLHLKYPRWLWWLMSFSQPGSESPLRNSDHIKAIEEAGFSATAPNQHIINVSYQEVIELALPFRLASDDDLRCTMLHVVTTSNQSKKRQSDRISDV